MEKVFGWQWGPAYFIDCCGHGPPLITLQAFMVTVFHKRMQKRMRYPVETLLSKRIAWAETAKFLQTLVLISSGVLLKQPAPEGL